MKEFKPFLLDPVDYALYRVGEQGQTASVPITAKAFDVLRYFVEHPGRLITHHELLEAFWADVEVQPEVLKGHVLAIRTALNDDAQKPRFLETHRGRGYRFIAPVENVQRKSVASESLARPLIGRDVPWAQLQELFEQSAHGKTNVVFIRGDAGIGKTALIEKFCKDLGARRAWIASGRCIEGFAGVEPFYPFIEALAQWVKGEETHRVQDALLSHAPSWGSLLGGLLSRDRRALLLRAQGVVARSRVLGEFCELLEFLSESAPIVLWLDDIHWADYSSLDLISAISRRQSNSRIMLIGTLRTDEVSERSNALKQLVDDLQLHRLCSVIGLNGLTEHDVAEYIGTADADAANELAVYLRHRSGGNPLFLSIVLEHLRDTGAVSQWDGKWTHTDLKTIASGGVPPSIKELVESKIRRIDEHSRRALEAASAVGEAFTPLVPAAAAGLDAMEFEEICENLNRADNFIERQSADGSSSAEKVHVYKFKHSLFRDVFLARQGPLGLARSHALIAKQLESVQNLEGEPHISFELAEQFSSARDWTKAISYLRIALQTAKRRFAHQDALTILDKADRVASHMADENRMDVQMQLMEDRASIYAASHDRRALELFTRLAETAATYSRTDVQARAELGQAFSLSWSDISGCMTHLETAFALSHAQPNSQLRARLRLASGAWRIWIGGWTRELADIVDANLRPLRNGDDRQITAWGLIEYSMVCLVSSRYREALETIGENVAILIRHAFDRPEFNVFRAIWMAHLGRPWTYIFLGEWGLALSEFDASEALFVANANRYSICTLETLRGVFYFMAGNHQGVRDICVRLGFYKDRTKETHDPLYTLQLTNEIRHCTLLAGIADVGLGERCKGIETLSSLNREMHEHPVVLDWYWQFLCLWVLASALLSEGDVDAARAHADEMVNASQLTEEGTWQSLALELRARVALKDGDLDVAISAIERAMSIVEQVGVPLAEWRIHRSAVAVYRARDNDTLVQFHERQFDNATTLLLDSLPKSHVLRESFRQSIRDGF